MLYCAAADGCAPALHDFASTETNVTHSPGAGTDAAACLVITPPSSPPSPPSPPPSPPPFSGHFADPNHPGCPRSIIANATAAAVSGKDAEGPPWTVRASVSSGPGRPPTILVDFSPKGGPKALNGTWTGASIAWEDGNAWRLLAHGETTHCGDNTYQVRGPRPRAPPRARWA